MFAAIGLGNPGSEYSATRHNVGFWALESLLAECRAPSGVAAAEWKRKGESSFVKIKLAAGGPVDEVLLVRPEGYMNRSGEAALPVLQFFKVEPTEIVVLHDDLDLPSGRLRLRKGGSAAGHRGVLDLIQVLGTPDFFRARIGIGRPEGSDEKDESDADVRRWVLSKPDREETARLRAAAQRASQAALLLFAEGLEAAQREFNREIKLE